jgi:hypothetical protein
MGRNATLLRGALLVDAVVFLTAALLNMGVWVPLGFAELRFAVPVWQAGIGEAIIGITLLVAGLTGWARLPHRLGTARHRRSHAPAAG